MKRGIWSLLITSFKQEKKKNVLFFLFIFFNFFEKFDKNNANHLYKLQKFNRTDCRRTTEAKQTFIKKVTSLKTNSDNNFDPCIKK